MAVNRAGLRGEVDKKQPFSLGRSPFPLNVHSRATCLNVHLRLWLPALNFLLLLRRFAQSSLFPQSSLLLLSQNRILLIDFYLADYAFAIIQDYLIASLTPCFPRLLSVSFGCPCGVVGLIFGAYCHSIPGSRAPLSGDLI